LSFSFVYIFVERKFLSKTTNKNNIYIYIYKNIYNPILTVTTDLVREEQFVHDLCLLGAVTVEITQILTRAGK